MWRLFQNFGILIIYYLIRIAAFYCHLLTLNPHCLCCSNSNLCEIYISCENTTRASYLKVWECLWFFMNKLHNEAHVKIRIRVFQFNKIINIKPFQGHPLATFSELNLFWKLIYITAITLLSVLQNNIIRKPDKDILRKKLFDEWITKIKDVIETSKFFWIEGKYNIRYVKPEWSAFLTFWWK